MFTILTLRGSVSFFTPVQELHEDEADDHRMDMDDIADLLFVTGHVLRVPVSDGCIFLLGVCDQS